ncbi:SDR family NAD(P)-dependent oxidoreductase [Actinoallomurus sp. CA-150999]|uniref:SDR family NAD(P)-dependent oxidoreductase n=1 Tax=Actinoallomurus sp. CA-150999 TaxID=3239887 RepID=UPI003D93E0D1
MSVVVDPDRPGSRSAGSGTAPDQAEIDACLRVMARARAAHPDDPHWAAVHDAAAQLFRAGKKARKASRHADRRRHDREATAAATRYRDQDPEPGRPGDPPAPSALPPEQGPVPQSGPPSDRTVTSERPERQPSPPPGPSAHPQEQGPVPQPGPPSNRTVASARPERRAVPPDLQPAPTMRSPEQDSGFRPGPPGDRTAGSGRLLVKARRCYVCKAHYRLLHPEYHLLCPECAEENLARRHARCDLRGRRAIVTGGRVKIGFQLALKLLRDGAEVLVTTRFPRDAARRFAAVPDAGDWLDRLRVHGVDLLDLAAVAGLLEAAHREFPSLDILVNNAAQTIRRPAAYHREVRTAERAPLTGLAARIDVTDAATVSGASVPFGPTPATGASMLLGPATTPDAPSLPHVAPGRPSLPHAPGAPSLPHASGAPSLPHATASPGTFPRPRPPVEPGAPSLPEAGTGEAVPAAGLPDRSPDGTTAVAAWDDALEALFPAGRTDETGQPLDLRDINSWSLRLHEVDPSEWLEVHLVNSFAPFLLTSRLRGLLEASPWPDRYVVQVSAMEGSFSRGHKTVRHPHTNMAKAALNMLTRTSAADYAASGIHMTSVDTGWVTDERPHPDKAVQREAGFRPPLDVIDGAARVYDPIVRGVGGERLSGLFLKDYRPVDW